MPWANQLKPEHWHKTITLVLVRSYGKYHILPHPKQTIHAYLEIGTVSRPPGLKPTCIILQTDVTRGTTCVNTNSFDIPRMASSRPHLFPKRRGFVAGPVP